MNENHNLSTSDRDEEIQELRCRVAYLEGLLASSGLEPEACHGEHNRHEDEEKKQEETSDGHAAMRAAHGEGGNALSPTAEIPSEDGQEFSSNDNPNTDDRSTEDGDAKPPADTERNESSKETPFHPPGTKPGGIWYKQTYKGSRTRTASNLACCFLGCTESYLVSQIAMDERLVYFDQCGSRKHYDAYGQVVIGVIAQGSTLSWIPAEEAKGAIERGQVPPPLANPEPGAKKSTAPPGLPEGGLFYKQYIRNGRTRLIYRPNPLGMDFYDQNGERVNLFEGPVVPPVTMSSMILS